MDLSCLQIQLIFNLEILDAFLSLVSMYEWVTVYFIWWFPAPDLLWPCGMHIAGLAAHPSLPFPKNFPVTGWLKFNLLIHSQESLTTEPNASLVSCNIKCVTVFFILWIHIQILQTCMYLPRHSDSNFLCRWYFHNHSCQLHHLCQHSLVVF